MATGINAFFLIRSILVPPFEALIEHTCRSLGIHIRTSFFDKAPLSKENDRYVIDRLLKENYGYNSASDKFKESDLIPINHTLATLCRYINKYNAPFLGNLINHDKIIYLENAVLQYTLNGITVTTMTFLNRKIDFKETKLDSLYEAKNELLNDLRTGLFKSNYGFFKITPEAQSTEPSVICEMGLSLLNQEIDRQNDKLQSLRACLN